MCLCTWQAICHLAFCISRGICAEFLSIQHKYLLDRRVSGKLLVCAVSVQFVKAHAMSLLQRPSCALTSCGNRCSRGLRVSIPGKAWWHGRVAIASYSKHAVMGSAGV